MAKPDSATYTIAMDDLGLEIANVTILEHVTARIEAGRITAVIGPNGAGKTTLLLAILGQLPYTGAVRFEPRDEAAAEQGSGGDLTKDASDAERSGGDVTNDMGATGGALGNGGRKSVV